MILKWNEEYALSFTNGNAKFSTPKGRGFSTKLEAEAEAVRLVSKGFKDVTIYLQKWSLKND